MEENSASDRDDFRVLGKFEVSDLFRIENNLDRVRVPLEHPIIGELWSDKTGAVYLAPEEDYQGGADTSVPIVGLPEDKKYRFLGRTVKIAGTFVRGIGLTVEWIALKGRSSEI